MPGDRMYFTSHLSRNEVIGLMFRITLFGALSYFGIRWMVNAIDPTRKQKVEAQKRAERILSRIGVTNVKLSEYELTIAAQLVDPQSITISWDDIAGLDDIIQEIRETVILPIQKRELFAGSQLIQPPKGVLLHGPPGCGKTMIAKATAREAVRASSRLVGVHAITGEEVAGVLIARSHMQEWEDPSAKVMLHQMAGLQLVTVDVLFDIALGARFVNLEVSALTDKWYGESQKLAAAVFTLAIKIQPCIVFIDEIDSFLRSRDTHDHEATAMMKAQFMSLWDGLITDPECQVIVMGATNRPQDVDRAILRRMPSMFHIGLPNQPQRNGILKLVLENEVVSEDVDVVRIAKLTEGFSGSDIRELCRNAALYRVRDYLKEETQQSEFVECTSDMEHYHDALRPICMDDFMSALTRMKESKVHSAGYMKQSGFDLD